MVRWLLVVRKHTHDGFGHGEPHVVTVFGREDQRETVRLAAALKGFLHDVTQQRWRAFVVGTAAAKLLVGTVVHLDFHVRFVVCYQACNELALDGERFALGIDQEIGKPVTDKPLHLEVVLVEDLFQHFVQVVLDAEIDFFGVHVSLFRESGWRSRGISAILSRGRVSCKGWEISEDGIFKRVARGQMREVLRGFPFGDFPVGVPLCGYL